MSEVDNTEWFLVLDRIIMVILALDVFANFLTGATFMCSKHGAFACMRPRHTINLYQLSHSCNCNNIKARRFCMHAPPVTRSCAGV